MTAFTVGNPMRDLQKRPSSHATLMRALRTYTRHNRQPNDPNGNQGKYPRHAARGGGALMVDEGPPPSSATPMRPALFVATLQDWPWRSARSPACHPAEG
jgi:hypothetical protein